MNQQVVRPIERTVSTEMRRSLIDRVRAVDPFFAQAMEEHELESACEPVPFWTKTQLRTVCVKTAFRTMKRCYADNGVSLSPIARPEAIYAINAREEVALEQDALPAYVRFFVAHAGVGRGIRIVETEVEAGFVDDKWLSPKDIARKNAARLLVRSMSCSSGIVLATAIRALDLVEVAIKVAPTGIVEALTTVIVVEDVPVIS